MTSDSLNIAAIALDIVWGAPEVNLNAAEAFINRLSDDTDIVVLPELFTTGMVQDETLLAELSSQKYVDLTLNRIKAWAQGRQCAVCGSFTAAENGKLFNRAFFITPNDRTVYYDKRHLFSVSAEGKVYTAGTAIPPVIPYKGWNISMMICYDLRFPVWSRNHHHAYDMMLVPANWPTARAYAWDHLLIARAIENQAVYVGCDRSGKDDYGTYDGLSKIVDALGRPVSSIAEGTEEQPLVLTATVSLSEIHKSRRKLPVVDSADDYTLIIN